MVVLSLEAYLRLTDGVETALDEADRAAMEDDRRYTHEEVRRFLYNKQDRDNLL